MPDHRCEFGTQGSRIILDQIVDKWSILILATLCERPLRFNEIRRQIGTITQKALTQCLRRLERNGLVHRRVLVGSPVAVEYSVTELGVTLKEPFEVLGRWTLEHGGEVRAAQSRFDARLNETAVA